MTTSNVAYLRVVSGAEWVTARKEFLIKEKALTRLRDQLNAERRRLPMVKIEKDYVGDQRPGARRQAVRDRRSIRGDARTTGRLFPHRRQGS